MQNYSFTDPKVTQYTDSFTNETFTDLSLGDDVFNSSSIGYYEMVTYSETINGYDVRHELNVHEI